MTSAILLHLVLLTAPVGSEDTCSSKLGTAIEWERSIEAAAAKAKQSGKLLLALHVSGEFDDPALT